MTTAGHIAGELGLAIFAILALVVIAMLPAIGAAQWAGRDGWIEEPAATTEGEAGRSYMDTSSIHRGDDGLVYFNESTGVSRPEEIGKKGFMKDAYDCAKDLKYMCIGPGDWRNDLKSTIRTARDPALPIYRKYLCGEDATATDAKQRSRDSQR